MATSGSSNYSLNRNDIITEAFDLLGIGAEGESLSSDMIDRANRSLNMMVKSWQKDVDLWTRAEGSLTLVASQASYTMGLSTSDFTTARPLRIFSVRYRESGIDTPMHPIAYRDYYNLPDKTSTGRPVNWYYDRQLSEGVLYIWQPLQSGVTATLQFTYARSIEDFDTSTDDADFPQEWFECLAYNLARRLGTKYGVLTQEVKEMAIITKAEMLAWDEDDESVFFAPDFA